MECGLFIQIPILSRLHYHIHSHPHTDTHILGRYGYPPPVAANNVCSKIQYSASFGNLFYLILIEGIFLDESWITVSTIALRNYIFCSSFYQHHYIFRYRRYWHRTTGLVWWRFIPPRGGGSYAKWCWHKLPGKYVVSSLQTWVSSPRSRVNATYSTSVSFMAEKSKIIFELTFMIE